MKFKPKIKEHRFPATKGGHMSATYYHRRHPPQSLPPPSIFCKVIPSDLISVWTKGTHQQIGNKPLPFS